MKPDRRTDLQKITDARSFDEWSSIFALLTMGLALVYWLVFGS